MLLLAVRYSDFWSTKTALLMGGILVFWESWQNHVVNCEEMKLSEILGLNVKLKNDERKFLQIMTIKREEKVRKSDKREVQLSREVPP